MTTKKRNTETRHTKTDRALFVGGIIAITLLGIYLAGTLFAGHVAILLMEVVLYIAILVTYFGVLRASRPSRSAVTFARIVSYVGMGGAILTAAFVAYFLATFRW